MNSTRRPGRIATSLSASSPPFMPGITTSVTSRSMARDWRAALASASVGLAAVTTTHPDARSTSQAKSRTPSSSSASSTVPATA